MPLTERQDDTAGLPEGERLKLPPGLVAELRRRAAVSDEASPARFRPLERARVAAAARRHFEDRERLVGRRAALGSVAAAVLLAGGVWWTLPPAVPNDFNVDGRVDIIDAMLLARAGEAQAADRLAMRVVRAEPLMRARAWRGGG